MTTGIYKITNKVNGSAYIGLSIDVETRWQSHRNRAFNSNGKEYEKALYRAIRKYGLDNFTFEILEECSEEQLKDRETYWISFYDTYNNGYNETPGGDRINVGGENHPNHKLTVDDVIEIRLKWASCTISTRELYYQYQDRIGKSGFHKIYTWQTWKDILPELNTQERRDWHANNLISYCNIGDKNVNSLLTEAQFNLLLEKRNNGATWHELYDEFGEKYSSYDSFVRCCRDRIKTIEKYKPVSTIPVVGE